MAKTTKRKSQSMSAGITALQYEESLAKYAANHIQLKELGVEMEKEIQIIRDEFDSDINILTKEQELLMALIKGYCTQNRDSILGDKKSFDTLFGKLGFRMGTPSVKCLKGFKLEDVIEKLKEMLPEYVRTIEEADKAKLIADREKEEVASKFSIVGIQITQEEKFFIDLKEEVVTA